MTQPRQCEQCGRAVDAWSSIYWNDSLLCQECYDRVIAEIALDDDVHPDDSPDLLPDEAFDEARLP